MKKTIIIFLLFFIEKKESFSQNAIKADSLKHLTLKLPNDTVKVNKLNSLVQKMEYTDAEKAKKMALLSIDIAQKLNYELGLAVALRLRGVLYADKTQLDSAKIFYDKAFVIVSEKNDRLFIRQKGLLYHNYGTLFHYDNKFDLAVQKYQQAIKVFESIKEDELLFFPYNNLVAIEALLEKHELAANYAQKAYLVAKKSNNKDRIISSINNLCYSKQALKQYDGFEKQLIENIALGKSNSNFYQLAISHNLLGQYYYEHIKDFDKSVIYFEKAIVYIENAGNKFYKSFIHNNLARSFLDNKKFEKAIVNFKKANELAKEIEVENIQQYSIKGLAEAEFALGNYKVGYEYLDKLLMLNDTVNAKYNRNKVTELETKFETEKKETQIKLQSAQIKQKTTNNYLLIGGLSTLAIISLLGFRNYKNRQKLDKQRIAELETKQQLTATEAVLKGEEQERTRLAKDLHDGLGGMLSGIKHSFASIKGNMVMSADNTRTFERSLDMVDNSIKEMRRVAHNMMPEALVKFGLNAALIDYYLDINDSGAIKIDYKGIGIEKDQIDQTKAITIYRIIQELTNNIIKHAHAKSAIVQVIKDGNRLNITVEDDGKGFDKAILKLAKGIGWSNIYNRVEFLKGKIEVDSEIGKGTTVFIKV